MQTFCTFLFDYYEIQTDTDVVCLLSAVNNDSCDWSVQYKQRIFCLETRTSQKTRGDLCLLYVHPSNIVCSSVSVCIS